MHLKKEKEASPQAPAEKQGHVHISLYVHTSHVRIYTYISCTHKVPLPAGIPGLVKRVKRGHTEKKPKPPPSDEQVSLLTSDDVNANGENSP